MKNRFLSQFALAALLLSTGCGGSGGGEKPPTNSSQIQANVRVIPADGTVQIQHLSANQIQLTGQLPAIAEGDVLVHGASNSFLRKAKLVDRSRGTVTVTTEPGTIEDLFTSAQISVVRTLGIDDLDNRSVGDHGTTVDTSRAGGAIHIGVPERVLASAGGVDVKLDGGLDLTFDLDFQLRISGAKVEHLRAVLTTSGTAGLRVRGGFNGINVKHHLKKLIFKPIVITAGVLLGVPVPIVINPEADIYVTIRGDMAAEFTATATAHAVVQGGAEFNGSDWSLVKSFDKGFDLSIERNFSTGSNVTFCPVRTEGAIKLYNVLGPTFVFQPDFICRYDRQANPAGLNVSVEGAFNASAALHVEAIGRTWVDRQFPNIIDNRFSIWNRFFPDSSPGGGGGGGGSGGRTEVQIDNSNVSGSANEPGFYKWGTPSYWHLVTGLGLNGSMLWTGNNHPPDQPLDNVGLWRPNLTGSGRYEILAYIPRQHATTTDANYEIWIAGSHFTTVRINQLAVSDAWVSLGHYELPAGTGSCVQLLDTTSEPFDTTQIGFDAIKFVPR